VSLNKIRTQLRENFKNLLAFLYINNLAAFVRSGLRVNAVRNLGFTCLFIDVELRRLDRIMSSTLTRAGL
jgi:hypothetical protein